MSSHNVTQTKSYTTAGGYNGLKWEISSKSGNITSAGQVRGGSSLSDYAEYFESADGKEIPTGTIVTLKGEKNYASTIRGLSTRSGVKYCRSCSRRSLV
ncbi:peptidase G2 autoproteolytic cleavage domain-containing protein [Bacillus sp. SL00103]